MNCVFLAQTLNEQLAQSHLQNLRWGIDLYLVCTRMWKLESGSYFNQMYYTSLLLVYICIFVIFELTANNLYNSKMKDIQILGIFRIARGILCVCVNYQLSIVAVVYQLELKLNVEW